MKKIEITDGINGYPKHVHRGVIGFETYEQAKKFAEEHDGDVYSFRKRDGWDLWESLGRIDHDYDLQSFYNNGEMGEWREFDKENDFDYMKELLNDCDVNDIDKMRNIIGNFSDLCEAQAHLEDDEFLAWNIDYETMYCQAEKKRVMSFHEDVWTYAIGVSFSEMYPEEIEELQF